MEKKGVRKFGGGGRDGTGERRNEQAAKEE